MSPETKALIEKAISNLLTIEFFNAIVILSNQLGATDVKQDTEEYKGNKYDDLLIKIMEDEYLSKPVDSDFEDLDNCDKPFRTEWAMESITESNSRFKRRNSDG